MKNLKNNIMKNKKTVVIVGGIALLLIGVGGYFVYDNNRKNEIRSKMDIVFTDVKEVEYGTKDFDVKKELVQDIENCELTDFSDIDPNKIGKVTLVFTLKKDDVIKEVEHTVNIIDTKAPEISLETENKELTVGDKYDFMSNIKSVNDIVDGDIQFNKDAIELNKKATEEYNKLTKDDIKEDTKVADKLISEFMIEDIKDEEEKSLYLKNCYYIDGSVDTSKAGEYKINVIVIDKNGNKATKQVIINVKEKEDKVVVNNSQASSSNKSTSSSETSSGTSTKKGSIQAVIKTALAQIGKSYVYGASGPDSFDCSGLIYYSYRQNGYNVPRAIRSAGRSIGTNMAKAQVGDIIVKPDHVSMISEKEYSGREHEGMKVYAIRIVEATTDRGVIQSSQFFPMCVRSDGKIIGTEGQILNDFPYWSDIRHVQ